MLKELQKIYTENKWVLSIFLFALAIRLAYLGKFPIGITHDELNYIIAAKSLFFTGNFAPGTASAILPVSMGNATVVIAEVPAYILSLLIGWTDSSLFASRVWGAVFSSVTVIVFYFLILELLDNKKVALVSALVMAFNPWSILMGRTAFEVNFFVFFFLSGFLVLLKSHGKNIYYSVPLYLLGFLSYTGGQVSFYLFMVITLIYHKSLHSKDKLKHYFVYFIIVTAILLAYVFAVMQNQSSSDTRGKELYLPTSTSIKYTVDSERKVSVPSRSNNVLINKATVYTSGWIEKYYNAFSVDDLFIKGEFRAAFSYQKHGTFYFIDFLFIITGMGFLFSKNKKVWWLSILIIASAAVTGALSTIEQSYSQRTGLIYPFIILFVGLGIYYFLSEFKDKWFSKLFVLALFVGYGVLFANLMHTYFYRFPVYASDGWFYQDRLMSRYIGLITDKFPEKEIVIVTFEPKILFQEYLFYSDNYNDTESISSINYKMNNGNFQVNNVQFISSCKDVERETSKVVIYDGFLNCVEQEDTDVSRITRFRDTYAKYQIKNDLLCSQYELSGYVHPVSYLDFEVETQSTEAFCKSWITRLR